MAIVRNLQNNAFYEYLGNNRFKNLATGAEGEVSDEKARDIFVVNLEATHIIETYPHVRELISKLNLKTDIKQTK